MALFFNLQTLESLAKGNDQKLLAMLEHHFNKKVLPSKFDKFSPAPFNTIVHGHSFLISPAPFFKDTTTDILFKVQYLKLAAKRDYLLYKQYQYKALQRSFFPDLNYEGIKHNPLLVITSTEVNFKYE